MMRRDYKILFSGNLESGRQLGKRTAPIDEFQITLPNSSLIRQTLMSSYRPEFVLR